jgi:MHS family proline/betaine transporter-like MFS transporter
MISVIVALFGITLTTLLTHQQLVDWGRRIPYVFGLLVGPAGLFTTAPEWRKRRSSSRPPSPATVPIGDLVRRQPVQVLLALGASIISNSSYYLLLYIPTYAVKQLHLPASTGLIATLVGGVILGIFSLVAGHWSDRTPRTRIMLVMCWLFFLTSTPFSI